MDDGGLIPSRGGEEVFSSLLHPHQHYSMPSLLSNGY